MEEQFIAVSLIVEGQFKNAVMPSEIVNELAIKLREEGAVGVHFANESVICEGVVILAKGSKNKLIVLPNVE